MDTDEQEDAHEPTVQATVGIMTRFFKQSERSSPKFGHKTALRVTASVCFLHEFDYKGYGPR